MSKIRHVTFEERKVIEEKIKKGMPNVEIGKLLGRNGSTISWEIQRNGGRDNYKAKKAQERYDTLKKNNWEKSLAKRRILANEVDALKMIVDILTEEIKEIKKKL